MRWMGVACISLSWLILQFRHQSVPLWVASVWLALAHVAIRSLDVPRRTIGGSGVFALYLPFPLPLQRREQSLPLVAAEALVKLVGLEAICHS